MTLLILFTLFAGASSLFLDHPLHPNENAIRHIALKTVPDGICVDSNFRYCQGRFNEALNLSPTLDWHDSDALMARIRDFTDGNITTVFEICGIYQEYRVCFHGMYPSCVNLYHLLSQDPKGINQAYTYVNTFQALDFICNIGFQEAVKQMDCIVSSESIPQYMVCYRKYVIGMNMDPSNICGLLSETGNCLHDVYKSNCPIDPRAGGWFGCEMFRHTFEDSCDDGGRCSVY